MARRKKDTRPLVDVQIRGNCSPKKKCCPKVGGKALVDTGAAGSFIDLKTAKRLKLKKIGRAKVYGIAGGKKPLTLDKYAVTMMFPELGLRDVPLLSKGAYAKPDLEKSGRIALIGRDSMAGGDDPKAGLRVEYDGPSHRLKLRQSAIARADEEIATRAARARRR